MFGRKITNDNQTLVDDKRYDLDLGATDITDTQLASLQIANPSEVCSLSLENSLLTAASSTTLINLLESLPNLTKLNLNLSRGVLTPAVLDTVVSKELVTLDIGYNEIDESTFSDFLKSVSSNTSLTRLGLAQLDLNSKHGVGLAEVLRKNTTLRSLNLARNVTIGKSALEKICYAFRENSTLNTLNLSGCGFTNAALTFPKELKHNWSFLEYYPICHKEINDVLLRNRAFAQRVFKAIEYFNGVPLVGTPFHKAVYKCSVTYWDMQKLCRGGFSAIQHIFKVPKHGIWKLERLEAYLFLRDVVLGDIEDCKWKRVKFLGILATPSYHAHTHDGRERYVLLLTSAARFIHDNSLECTIQELAIRNNSLINKVMTESEVNKLIVRLDSANKNILLEGQSTLSTILEHTKIPATPNKKIIIKSCRGAREPIDVTNIVAVVRSIGCSKKQIEAKH